MNISDRDIEYIRARQTRTNTIKKNEPMHTRVQMVEYDNQFGGFTSEVDSRLVGVPKEFARMTSKPQQQMQQQQVAPQMQGTIKTFYNPYY